MDIRSRKHPNGRNLPSHPLASAIELILRLARHRSTLHHTPAAQLRSWLMGAQFALRPWTEQSAVGCLRLTCPSSCQAFCGKCPQRRAFPSPHWSSESRQAPLTHSALARGDPTSLIRGQTTCRTLSEPCLATARPCPTPQFQHTCAEPGQALQSIDQHPNTLIYLILKTLLTPSLVPHISNPQTDTGQDHLRSRC